MYVSHSNIHYQYRREMNHSQASMQTSVPDEELELLDDENVEDEVDNDVESKARLVKEETVQSIESAMASISDLKTFNRWPTLRYVDLLIFIYLGCVWLRWPILLSDLQRFVSYSVVGHNIFRICSR